MKKWVSLILILFLSFFAVKPLISKGYFPIHDDTQVSRVIVMGNALKEGQFPVRIVSDLGYGLGYPLFNFYGPLPYYVGGFFYAIGVDSVVATKIMFVIGTVIAPITLFLLLVPVFGHMAAVAGAMLFLYAPYHAVQIYIRGSVGEYWAIAFVPLILYGLLRAVKGKNPLQGIGISSIALAATILSHTILGFLTCIGLGIGIGVYFIILIIQKRFSKRVVLVPVSAVVLGLLLSAFFWIPAMMEVSHTTVSQMVTGASTTFFDHFVCLSQFWNSPWGFAGSAPGCVDGMSFKFGKVQLIIAGLSLGFLFLLRKSKQMKDKNSFMRITMGAMLVLIFLMLSVSAFVWNMFPFTSVIQYPWRLLTYGMMGLAICGAYFVSSFRIPLLRISIAVGIIAVTLFVNAKIFVPQYTYERSSSEFERFEELRFTQSKISDEYLPPEIMRPSTGSDVTKTTVSGSNTFLIRRLVEKTTALLVEIETVNAQDITVQKAWFPGWKVSVNGKKVEPRVTQGLPTVMIPQGVSIIEMQFSNTPVRTVANWLSIVGICMVGALYVYGKKTNA